MRNHKEPRFWRAAARRRSLTLAAATIAIAVAAGLGSAQMPPPIRVWTSQRLDAVVRIQVTPADRDAGSGTGFIVRGGQDYYVLTSTHVIYGRGATDDPSDGCAPLDGTVEIARREIDGERLTHANCAWSLGSDLSLLPLERREGGYPTLQLAAHDFQEYDMVFLAAFSRNYPLDSTRYGYVSIPRTPDDLVVSTLPTAQGMSGGPYLSDRGTVVGVHHGGVRYAQGMAHLVSVFRARPKLEPRVGSIPADDVPQPTAARLASMNQETASLGTVLALQDAPVASRPSLWRTYVGRPASAQEAAIIQSLPAEPATATGSAVFASLEGSQLSTLAVSQSISEASARAQLACREETMSIRNGLLYCGNRARYQQAGFVGTPITPRVIVMHFARSPSLQYTLNFMTSLETRISTHFLVDRDGSFVQLVPIDRAASHVGRSAWMEFVPLSNASVAIQLINFGQLALGDDGRFRTPGRREVPANEVQAVTRDGVTTYWHRFTGAQLITAERIARKIAAQYPIQAVIGHCVLNRRDPGLAFPMAEFGRAVLGHPSIGCP